MPAAPTIFFATLFGLAIGSFLNAAAHRIPSGASLNTRSACPGCGHTIRAYDLVPVLSWLALRARCRDCGTRISARYPLVETTSAALWGLLAARYGYSAELAIAVAAATFLGLLALIDLDTMRLPTPIVWGGVAVVGAIEVLTAASRSDFGLLIDPLIGVAMIAGPLFAVWLVRPGAMGFGDVRLAVLIGLTAGWFGPPVAAMALLFAALGQSAVSVVVIARGGTRKTKIPFGPFLALGAFAAVLWGQAAFDAYSGWIS